jgi:hypothetical protein
MQSRRLAYGDEHGRVLAEVPDPPYVAVIFGAVGTSHSEGTN